MFSFKNLVIWLAFLGLTLQIKWASCEPFSDRIIKSTKWLVHSCPSWYSALEINIEKCDRVTEYTDILRAEIQKGFVLCEMTYGRILQKSDEGNSLIIYCRPDSISRDDIAHNLQVFFDHWPGVRPTTVLDVEDFLQEDISLMTLLRFLGLIAQEVDSDMQNLRPSLINRLEPLKVDDWLAEMHAFKEFYETEKSYFVKIFTLANTVHNAKRRAQMKKDWNIVEKLQTVFLGIEDLANFHLTLIFALQGIQTFEQLMIHYEYIADNMDLYSNWMLTYNDLQDTLLPIENYLKGFDYDQILGASPQSLQSANLLPMQRLCKYPNLLEALESGIDKLVKKSKNNAERRNYFQDCKDSVNVMRNRIRENISKINILRKTSDVNRLVHTWKGINPLQLGLVQIMSDGYLRHENHQKTNEIKIVLYEKGIVFLTPTNQQYICNGVIFKSSIQHVNVENKKALNIVFNEISYDHIQFKQIKLLFISEIASDWYDTICSSNELYARTIN